MIAIYTDDERLMSKIQRFAKTRNTKISRSNNLDIEEAVASLRAAQNPENIYVFIDLDSKTFDARLLSRRVRQEFPHAMILASLLAVTPLTTQQARLAGATMVMPRYKFEELLRDTLTFDDSSLPD
jgi:hypothetical protein